MNFIHELHELTNNFSHGNFSVQINRKLVFG